MKINLPVQVMLVFVCIWVIGDVCQSSYNEKLYWSLVMTVCFAYFNNAHGLTIAWIKHQLMRAKTS